MLILVVVLLEVVPLLLLVVVAAEFGVVRNRSTGGTIGYCCIVV